MAGEAVVSALIDKFTSTVADKLFQEVSLVVNFREDFEFFCDQLIYIKSLLTDADAGGKRNSTSVSKWLDSLENFVLEADYMVQTCGAEDTVERCGAAHHMFGKMIFRYQMGRKIRNLKEKLNNIYQNAKYLKYLASVFEVNARAQALDAYKLEDKRERSSALLREAETVGMQGDINVVTRRILQTDGPRVIAIVGMGGQGKTLLLQHIFNSEEVHKGFNCRVWLALSQKFDVIEVLRDVVNQFERNKRKRSLVGNDENRAEQPDDKELRESELREKINTYLEGKHCLFAVDDVWDRDAWENIGLPSGIEHKVVLTTRDEAVAKAMKAQIHPKIRLPSDMSWKLFCIHAFSDDAPEACPKELDEIAHSIVEKCAGNPLAIKTLGAYLARHVREVRNDWEETLLHLHKAYGMIDRVFSSLKLSYEALPSHLKPCFLYCSVFPKNTQIDTESLVHGWIAQGLVSVQLQDSYNVGLSYMEELIHRCLIEVSEVAGNGRAKSCKMHDLLHDVAVSEQTKCLLEPGGQLKSIPEDCQGLRRISLMKNEISAIEKGIQCPELQSLFLSHNYGITSIFESFFDNMKYLNVLDLSWTSITSLPDSIGNLKLLKYLNVSRTRILKLPESLSGLQQLQFLDVDGTDVSNLHSGIEKHKYMLHLNLGRRFECYPVGISKLTYLQTLNGVTFTLGNSCSASASASALQLRDLKGLTLLQHLSIIFKSDIDDFTLENEGTFRDMTKMRTLSVRFYGGTTLQLPTDMENMQRLEIVHLEHCVVPKWIFQLHNLMELSLTGPRKSSSADIRGLENIPNLKKLHLKGTWSPDFIEFPNEFGEAGAFPKLEELFMEYFEHLKSIPSFHKDAMPKLKCLRIWSLLQLGNMPEGLTELRNLKEVEVNMRVRDVEDYKHKNWQGLKDRQIKLKGGVWDGANELRLV